MPVTPADSNAASEMEQDEKATPAVPDSYWAKYNVKVERPQYTDEQYETHLKSEDWSKEETDYLVDLATEFDLRWVVISDRYEYKPSETPNSDEDSMAVTVPAKPRTQEDMKARYYDVAAKTMVLHNPLSSMSSTEFDAHEKMTKYDPIRETQRKRYAEQLMNRTKEEKDEEEFLLRELSRIVSNQEKLAQERKALYDRLEAAPSSARADSYSTTMYQTSQGLTQLMQNLLTQNKNKELEKKEKRRSLLEGSETAGPSSFHPMDRSQRQSLSSAPHGQRLSDATGRRPLTQQEQKKYGVSHPNERLTGGIQFRHERITKAGQAKSGVQTSRIGAALTELKIPPRLVMPTAKVVTEYERLIESIKHLLEVRKVSEKVDGEIKVLVAQKEQAEAKDRGEEIKQEEEQPGGSLEEGETQNEEDNERNGEDNDEDAEGEKEDSDDAEAGREESDNDDEDDEDAEGEVDDNVVADEVRDLQGDEDADGDDRDQEEDGEGEEDENENMDDEDAEGENADEDEDVAPLGESPAATPTTKSEGMHKRSASVMSLMSNRSSKRQKK